MVREDIPVNGILSSKSCRPDNWGLDTKCFSRAEFLTETVPGIVKAFEIELFVWFSRYALQECDASIQLQHPAAAQATAPAATLPVTDAQAPYWASALPVNTSKPPWAQVSSYLGKWVTQKSCWWPHFRLLTPLPCPLPRDLRAWL